MIIAAAVIIDGEVRALPAPARHHDILEKYPMPGHVHGEQGFIDDQEGFVDRMQARDIALHVSKQIDRAYSPSTLSTQDLW